MIKAPCDRDQNLNAHSVVHGLKIYYIGPANDLIQDKSTKWYSYVVQDVH
jgi:hypothetical protein